MRTNDKIHQLNLTEWAARFVEQKASGLTVKQWCEQNNYTIHTYNYWKHCLKEEVASQALPDIVPLAVPDPIPTSQLDNTHHSIQPVSSLTINDPNCSNRAMISLKSGDISIEFDSNISEEFLRTIIKPVRYA